MKQTPKKYLEPISNAPFLSKENIEGFPNNFVCLSTENNKKGLHCPWYNEEIQSRQDCSNFFLARVACQYNTAMLYSMRFILLPRRRPYNKAWLNSCLKLKVSSFLRRNKFMKRVLQIECRRKGLNHQETEKLGMAGSQGIWNSSNKLGTGLWYMHYLNFFQLCSRP